MRDALQDHRLPAESGYRAADQFERHRRYLTGLAYRMLGSLTEAEDAVQEAYLRWHGTDKARVESPRAFLAKVVTRICLDQMKSARVKRETYVGPWLPEPVLDAESLAAETASDYATDLSVGLMLALERLSPLERAAFLLHDVFDVEFEEVARLLGRNVATCRQLAARARAHIRDSRPRFQVQPDKGNKILQAFMTAYRTGNVDGLASVLSEDAVLYTDGGGKRRAALNPIVGRARILALLAGLARKRAEPVVELRPAIINGLHGCVATLANGELFTIAIEIASDKIDMVYVVRNPDKLKHVFDQALAGGLGSGLSDA
ncbi:MULTISPECIES: sigma-70 family RNA polymerase sigma factor [Bradyrhizobium]|uniref:sigma-70 family RNA polymerase sigma factor n=1 Tax=Bradyrhizobium TaxID=374 RepID=UPI001ED9F6A8|nr:sigma-70 family RNA polymerase sigma factor [Bradyrhizobium zhengyangense]MCG2641400.1 sigma-70 family RNA polymerase sigma factor [Bradyrhizobium zhengyangense]